MMNMNFAKPKEDNTPEYAPSAIVVDGRMILNPNAATYARAGYLPLSPDRPVDPPEGKHYERTDKIEPNGDGYRWVYALVDNPPPPPRTFDKYKLVDGLMNAGVWTYVETWLKETPDAWTRALMAPDISENEPLLAQGIAAVKELLGWTDEQVEEILAASVMGGV